MVMRRSPYSLSRPMIGELPDALAEKAAGFLQRQDVQQTFQALQWHLGIANLEQVLSFQKLVVLDEVDRRVAGAHQEDWNRLWAICLPDPNPPDQQRLFFDDSGKALTVSSLNPNLRVTAPIAQESIMGFAVGCGLSFVQVVEYNDRWFVRDGYHRCFGLLRDGITRVPCVFIKARTFAETGADQPNSGQTGASSPASARRFAASAHPARGFRLTGASTISVFIQR